CRGTEAYSREEHLHLFAGGVLALIKDHEGVVQGPATHERQGRHFDNSALHQFAYGFKSEHLEQSVIKGTQVRVNFLGEVAWQKSQLLASFHSGTHQQDALHFIFQQGLNGAGYGEVGLTCTSRAYAEVNVIVRSEEHTSELQSRENLV